MTDQFSLTDDQLAIQDMARKFTAERITPFAAKWDEEHLYPVDVWKAAGSSASGRSMCPKSRAALAWGGSRRH